MKIKDAVAVITGAAGGIGKAVAIELAKRGASGLALVDQSDAIHEVADATNKLAGSVVAVGYNGDVTSEDFRTGSLRGHESKVWDGQYLCAGRGDHAGQTGCEIGQGEQHCDRFIRSKRSGKLSRST